MKAILIDDEENALTTLQAMMSSFLPHVEIIGIATEGIQGIKLIRALKPDMVFLDINMPGLDGFEMLELIETRNFKVVVTSAHERYALKAIKNKVYDYLLKPINIDELEKVVNSIAEELKQTTGKNSSSLIKIASKKGTAFVKKEEIYYIKADGRYSEMVCQHNEKHYVTKNIGEFEEELKDSRFFRVHKSYLVNCMYVKNISSQDGGFIHLENGLSIEISRRKKAEFLKFLG